MFIVWNRAFEQEGGCTWLAEEVAKGAATTRDDGAHAFLPGTVAAAAGALEEERFDGVGGDGGTSAAPTPKRISRASRSRRARSRGRGRRPCNIHRVFHAEEARPHRAGHNVRGPTKARGPIFSLAQRPVQRALRLGRRLAPWRTARRRALRLAPPHLRVVAARAAPRRHFRSSQLPPSRRRRMGPPAVGDRGAQEVVGGGRLSRQTLRCGRRGAGGAGEARRRPKSPRCSARPVQRKRLEFSTDCPDERARRLAKVRLGALLDHHRSSGRRADEPPKPRAAAASTRAGAAAPPRSSSAPPRCRHRSRSPSSGSLKWWPPWRRILGCVKTRVSRLLSALREWGHEGLGALRHHRPGCAQRRWRHCPRSSGEALRAAAAVAARSARLSRRSMNGRRAPSLLPTDGGKPTAAAAAEAVGRPRVPSSVAVAAGRPGGGARRRRPSTEEDHRGRRRRRRRRRRRVVASRRRMTPRDRRTAQLSDSGRWRRPRACAPPRRVLRARPTARDGRRQSTIDSWLAQVAAVAQATHNGGEWRPDGRALPYQQLICHASRPALRAGARCSRCVTLRAAAAAKSSEEARVQPPPRAQRAGVLLVARPPSARFAAAPRGPTSRTSNASVTHAASLRRDPGHRRCASLDGPPPLVRARCRRRAPCLAARCASNLALLARAPPAADGRAPPAAAAAACRRGGRDRLGVAALRALLAAAAPRAPSCRRCARRAGSGSGARVDARPSVIRGAAVVRRAAAAAADQGGGVFLAHSRSSRRRRATRWPRARDSSASGSAHSILAVRRGWARRLPRAASTTTVAGGRVGRRRRLASPKARR